MILPKPNQVFILEYASGIQSFCKAKNDFKHNNTHYEEIALYSIGKHNDLKNFFKTGGTQIFVASEKVIKVFDKSLEEIRAEMPEYFI